MKSEGDEYYSAVASIVDEAKKPIETGFDFVCNHDKIMLFRKGNIVWHVAAVEMCFIKL